MANDKSIFKYLTCSCGYKKTDPTGKAKADCKNGHGPMQLTENWYARITAHGVTTVKAISPRRRDAEDYIAACKIAKREGVLLPGQEKDITWKDAKTNCEKWWKQDVDSKIIQQSTADFYGFMLIPLENYFSGCSLLTITKEMVGDYISERQKAVSLSTVSKELSALKRMYSLHLERLEMESRPKLMAKALIISKIKPPRVDNIVDRFCEPVEVKNVFQMIKDNNHCGKIARKRIRLGLMLGVGLGLRPVNVCKLEWKEIDFKAGLICIPGTKMKNKKDYVTGLPETIAQELQAWRKEQAAEGKISPCVFPSRKDLGKPMASMRKAMETAIRKANLNAAGVERKDKVTPYVLTRHTFASQALMASEGDLSSVSEQLHHSDVRITKKRYAKVNARFKKTKIEQYEQAVLKQMIE
jgi:integrase